MNSLLNIKSQVDLTPSTEDKMKNFKHQEETFERFKDLEYGALFQEPGVGKTRTMIQILEHKFTQGEIQAALVITTKGLMLNWADVELPKHSSLGYNTFVWSRDKELKNFSHLYYFIINIDALITKSFPQVMSAFLKMYPKIALVIDESTVVKTGSAKRTKMALKVARYAKCRFIMSGTPVTNSPMDLYSQCDILRPHLLGYSSLYAFRADYCITKTLYFGTRNFQKITGYKNLDQLTKIVKSFASIVKKADCLDLPSRMYRTIDTSFTPEQDTAYHELRQRALTYIQNHEITAVNAVSLINRLLQICSGQLKIGDNKYISIQNNRLPMLLELLEETPKTIVWTSFVNTAADIMKALNGTGRSVEHGDGMPKAVQLKSGMSIKERQETLEMFKKYNIALVANPASAGHGITLIETHNVIYYSNYWSFENRIQSEFRTDRIGQTQSVLYTDLITKGTIEEYVVELLQNKRELAETIITNTMSDPRDFLLRILK